MITGKAIEACTKLRLFDNLRSPILPFKVSNNCLFYLVFQYPLTLIFSHFFSADS